MQIFWKGFGLGFATAVGLILIGGIAVVRFFTGPTLAVEITLPEYSVLNEPFPIVLNVTNPHSMEIDLNNVEVPARFFDLFEVDTVSPPPSEDSPVSWLGSQVWYYELSLAPGSSQIIEFRVRPKEPGAHVVELQVCNAYEDCTSVAHGIDVRARDAI